MASSNSIKVLESRIGREAAKLGIESRNIFACMAFGASVAVLGLQVVPGPVSPIALVSLAVFMLAGSIAYVSRKIKLARLLSMKLGARVSWYAVPSVAPIATFEKWLDSKLARKAR